MMTMPFDSGICVVRADTGGNAFPDVRADTGVCPYSGRFSYTSRRLFKL